MALKLPTGIHKDLQFVIAALTGLGAIITGILQSPIGPLVPTTWGAVLTGALTAIATVSGFLKKADTVLASVDALP
ncbi:hypothetical protein ABW16_01650 [Mycolicibacter heraklionensis]|uniref:Holin n=1 Tax=Mycolicibacter heraklionensis TaxID=512402 RepID=A0ABR5FKQ0_9MYCO|nr:hypothetical protein [Mycolicibacter heraklionensis]KLO31571.1 hypothetical protein ABW16_01650 [Mycolicibacter heraklionensis]